MTNTVKLSISTFLGILSAYLGIAAVPLILLLILCVTVFSVVSCMPTQENLAETTGAVTESATETETGLRKSNCRICGHEETTVIPMLNTAGGNDAADGADSENQGNNNVTEPEQDNTMLVIYISVGAAVLLVVVVVILIIVKGSKKKAKAEKQEP